MPGRSSIAATDSTSGPVVGDPSSPDALTDSQSREESRAFLQRRVASFGLMLAMVFGMFFLWRLSSALLGDDSPSQAFLPWQALSIAVFGGLWAICRGRPRSFRVIHVLEFSGLCLAGGAATMMCLQVSYAARPDVILLLCMTYTLIARAIMIPSSATRTFLTSQGGVPDVAKVLDFGLVKQVRPIEVDATELKPLTQDNSVTGTPQYMAPEAITTPESVDARTDVYAVGAVAYFLLTGQHVFSGSSLVEICSHHLLSPPPLPSQTLGSHVPHDLESLVLRCLEKEPHQRPSSARVLREHLRECQDAGSWTEADARRWLEAHDPALRAQKAPGKLEGSATLAVDFGLRSNTPTRTRGATLT